MWQPPCSYHDAFITDIDKPALFCSITSTAWFLLISVSSLCVIEPQEESRKKYNAQKFYFPTTCLSLLSCLPASSRGKSVAFVEKKKKKKETWVVFLKCNMVSNNQHLWQVSDDKGDWPELSHHTALMRTLNLKPGAIDLIHPLTLRMDPTVKQRGIFCLYLSFSLKRKVEWVRNV